MSLPQYDVDVAVLGSAECGKSTFISALCQGLSAREFGNNTYKLERRDRQYIVRFHENAVTSRLSSSSAILVIFCFDVTDRTTLISIQQYWHQELIKSSPEKSDAASTLLLGLKRDKRNDANPADIIDPQEAIKAAGEMRISMYAECSVKTGELMRQVAEDFLKIIRTTVDGRNQDTYSYCIVA